MSFESTVNIVMEWIFKCESEELVCSLEFEGDSTNDSFVGSPAQWYTSGSIEKSWSNFSGFEIFLKSSFFQMPSNNLNNIFRLIPNFNLMESITIPVVSLVNIAAVKIVLNIVVMTKVICRIDKSTSHSLYLFY